MRIQRNYDLTKLNTFGISVNAKFFVELNNETELMEVFDLPEFKNNRKIFLGGGSNVLFTKDFDGIVVLNKLQGIKILSEDSESVIVRVMSGEIWHDLVNFSVGRGYWGIENLSLIPGTVGAAPMQNIGAYGVELKDVLENVETFDITTGENTVFEREECALGYRDSVFKNKLKDKYFISSITVKLSKLEKKNISYKILAEYLEKNKIVVKNSKDISEAVASIRRSKLPDPKVMGNAGSFFKSPFVKKEKIDEMRAIYPDMPYFEEGEMMKVPAGWLIEQAGWKGMRVGKVGVHEKHALILVNYGGGSGEEIKILAEQIIASVYAKFGLKLIPEVNFI